MDVGLYILAMLTFAILYLALGVFLLWVLVLTFVVIFGYLAIRYKDVSNNYPHGVGDSMITLLFISITWSLFVFLGPHPPEFLGSGLTYGVTTDWGWIAAIALIVVIIMMCIMAILLPYLEGKMSSGGGGGGGDEGKGPKVGVGA